MSHRRCARLLGALLATGALVVSGLAAPNSVAVATPVPAGGAGPAAFDLSVPEVAPGEAAVGPGARGEAFGLAAGGPRRSRVLVRKDPGVTAPDARRTVQRVQVVHDRATGVLSATADFAQAPTAAANSVLVVYVGEWDGDSCLGRAALAAAAHGGAADGAAVLGETQVDVRRSLAGARLTVRTASAAPAIRAADWECTWVQLRHPSEPTTLWQAFFPRDLVEGFTIAPGVPVQGSYAGKPTRVRIDVRNGTRTDATGVRIRAAGTGLRIARPTRSLGTVRSRSTVYGVTFPVRLTGAKQRRLTFTVTAEGNTYRRSIVIARKPRPTRPASLGGRYFWGHRPVSTTVGWDLRAVWFLDARWVHLGFPRNGVRPRCTRVTQRCKRYTYDRSTGTVRFGGGAAKVTSEGFTHRRTRYYPTTLARKGQRFKLELIRNDFRGQCGISCVTWTEWLSMDRKGRFVLSRQTLGSIGAPGVGTIWAGMPPDQRGRYRVIAPGRLELAFADGTRQRRTFAIQHDVRGRPSPAGAGVVFGDRNFYLD